MRKAALALTGAALLAAPALAQQTGDTSFGGAIAATISQHLMERGASGYQGAALAGVPQAIQAVANGNPYGSWITWFIHAGRERHWFPMNLFYGYPLKTMTEGETFGPFEYGVPPFEDGRLGDLDCPGLILDLDALDQPMVPSIPLPGSGPIVQGAPVWHATQENQNSGDDIQGASSPLAALLWRIHRYNVGRPKDQWFGVWSLSKHASASQYASTSSRPSHITLNGTRVQTKTDYVFSIHYNNLMWSQVSLYPAGPWSQPCPEAEGGDFHFYAFSSPGTQNGYDQLDGCTWYEPNLALSPTGYAYPEATPVPFTTASMVAYLEDHWQVANCPINPEIIRRVSDAIWSAIASPTSWNGPDYERITLAQVRTAGGHPTGLDLRVAPALPGQSTYSPGTISDPNPGQPAPDYVEPAAGHSGNGPGGDSSDPGDFIDIEHPDVPDPTFSPPELSMPDWLPDLPAFNVPTGSGQCPIFGFNAFEQSYVMDTHCTIIEDYKASIASIMLVVFAFMSYAIVLRA